jgi:hypothetical protein
VPPLANANVIFLNKIGGGKIIWPNGRVYDGLFEDDHIHGLGIYFSESGEIIKNKIWDKGEAIFVLLYELL